MANKLTKERIDLLIEQVMNEDINIGDIESQLKSNARDVYNSPGSTQKAKVIKVANNDDDKEDVSVKDITSALQD